MSRRPLEVADVVREHAEAFTAYRNGVISTAERRVLHDIAACRTSILGGHVERCVECGHERIAYNSCRNRHCPKCQGRAREQWLQDREAELLPVGYFHVVFTLPKELHTLARQNRRRVYGILFRTAAEALLQLAADPEHLGAQIGFVAILHTWGQRLDYHPHVHCVVPGGGLSSGGDRWIGCHPRFFLPVRALGRLFRGKFLDQLRQAFQRDEIDLHGALEPLRDADTLQSLFTSLYQKDWFVYVKPPFGGPGHVLRYLARYTHRVAISNARLVGMEDGKVRFRWKDYRRGDRRGVMALAAVEFLRRFLLHVLPDGFTRIRHYGLLANRNRAASLARCRALLATEVAGPPPTTSALAAAEEPLRCPECRRGLMRCVLVFRSGGAGFVAPVPVHDTS